MWFFNSRFSSFFFFFSSLHLHYFQFLIVSFKEVIVFQSDFKDDNLHLNLIFTVWELVLKASF